MAIRFAEGQVRETGRATQGVIGVRLRGADEVVSLAVVPAAELDSAELLAVSSQGYGKRTAFGEYPRQGRGGQGVITLKVTPRIGHLVSLSHVSGREELFALSQGGILIRTKVDQVSRYGRASQGVTVMRLGNDDQVVQALVLPAEDQVAQAIDEGDTLQTPPAQA